MSRVFFVELYDNPESDSFLDCSEDFDTVGQATKCARQALLEGSARKAVVVERTQIYALVATTKTTTSIKTEKL